MSNNKHESMLVNKHFLNCHRSIRNSCCTFSGKHFNVNKIRGVAHCCTIKMLIHKSNKVYYKYETYDHNDDYDHYDHNDDYNHYNVND